MTTFNRISQIIEQNKMGKKPVTLLNKAQLQLASYIKEHSDVNLKGTKRFTDKSGEYYLKNILLGRKDLNKKFLQRLSLTRPQNILDCIEKAKGAQVIAKRANKIITVLPENSLTPIPFKNDVKNEVDKKMLNDAERTAVFIRRNEYGKGVFNNNNYVSNNIKKNIFVNDEMLEKIIEIQKWWKMMFKIILIQKNFRGYLFRKQLMSILDFQEKIIDKLSFIHQLHKKILFNRFIKK